MKRPIYLLATKEEDFSSECKKLLRELDYDYAFIKAPDHHDELPKILNDKNSGVVLLAITWDDLLCVKMVEEIVEMERPFESVIFSDLPTPANLAAAFNRGLSGILTNSLKPNEFRLVLQRAFRRLDARMKDRVINKDVKAVKSDPLRDHLIGRAILQWLDGKGPVPFDKSLKALVVASSDVQGSALTTLLTQLGLSAFRCKNAAEARSCIDGQEYELVISDCQLPDGTALDVSSYIHQAKRLRLPRFIVWTSSPHLDPKLSAPEAHVDSIMRKPPPESGLASLLPTIFATVMSAQT